MGKNVDLPLWHDGGDDSITIDGPAGQDLFSHQILETKASSAFQSVSNEGKGIDVVSRKAKKG